MIAEFRLRFQLLSSSSQQKKQTGKDVPGLRFNSRFGFVQEATKYLVGPVRKDEGSKKERGRRTKKHVGIGLNWMMFGLGRCGEQDFVDPGNIAKGSVRLESRWINHHSYPTPITLIPVCFVVSALATPNRDRVILGLFPAHPYDHHHHQQHRPFLTVFVGHPSWLPGEQPSHHQLIGEKRRRALVQIYLGHNRNWAIAIFTDAEAIRNLSLSTYVPVAQMEKEKYIHALWKNPPLRTALDGRCRIYLCIHLLKPERLSTEKTDAKRHIDISPALHTALDGWNPTKGLSSANSEHIERAPPEKFKAIP
ncbi:uncharacterized protein H6S33_007636 [Morchella sextelata]|uniref:uncharacterized protein n=1 Tax=Morchella sextelata TaxID=1174677 RepID=UPI001D04AA40|nr:uncharacterized protein H6S33_007636 [Morchella sextelata]KAH0603314.1 hypothetical protein H6S33_007636 [Morchella sextelata]